MSDTTKVRSERPRALPRIRLIRDVGLVLAVALFAAAMLVAGTSGSDQATTDGVEEISATQAATCVEALNWTHAQEGRATRFLLWVWAEGSNTYLGWVFTTTSLQEGPTGTWTMVPQCGPGGTTSSSSSSSTSSSSTSSSSTSSSTTSSSTTSSTTPPPDGAAIYSSRCAACHGADGSGGAGPALGGVVDAHGVEAVTQVITNGRGAMPAWGGILSAAEIAAVVEYIATFEGEHGHEHHGEH